MMTGSSSIFQICRRKPDGLVTQSVEIGSKTVQTKTEDLLQPAESGDNVGWTISMKVFLLVDLTLTSQALLPRHWHNFRMSAQFT